MTLPEQNPSRELIARELTAVSGYENPKTLARVIEMTWQQGLRMAYAKAPETGRTRAENFHRALLGGIRIATCQEVRRGIEQSEPERLETLREHLDREGITKSQWIKGKIAETERHILKTLARKEFIDRFGFPVLTKEAVQIMELVTRGKKILEVGAGNGYLAYEMHMAGADILATEPHEPGKDSRYFTTPIEWAKEAVERLDAESAVEKHRRPVLMWSWPEPDADHTHQALRKFQGDTVIYIGEKSWGSTGSEEFHNILKTQFVKTTEIRLPRFPGARDRIRIYRR